MSTPTISTLFMSSPLCSLSVMGRS
jgi:hypothetical protein